MRTVYTLILALAALPISQTSHACTCVARPSIEDQYLSYSEVFLGVVTDVFPIETGAHLEERSRFRVMTKVVEIYKGTPPEMIAGLTHRDPADKYTSSCGPDYEMGRFYIVFRRIDPDSRKSDPKMPPGTTRRYSRPYFSACSHTVWQVSDEALEYLRSRKEQRDDA